MFRLYDAGVAKRLQFFLKNYLFRFTQPIAYAYIEPMSAPCIGFRTAKNKFPIGIVAGIVNFVAALRSNIS